jgi:hypothetical protein
MEILLVSTLSILVSRRVAWLVNNKASFHMIGSSELIDTLLEIVSYLCVELGTRSKYVV